MVWTKWRQWANDQINTYPAPLGEKLFVVARIHNEWFNEKINR
jgi:hypothetical protein